MERMQIGEVLKTRDIEFEELNPSVVKKMYFKAIKIFDNLPECKEVIYTLDNLVVMIFLASLCGSDSCAEYEVFWNRNHKLYGKIFGLDTVPSHDTFRRLLGLIDSNILNRVIVNAIESVDKTLRKLMHVPAAKRIEGTGRENTMGQILNFCDCDNETCLFSEAIDVQNILSEMDLRNTVISADSLHLQTAKIIAEKGGNYILELRDVNGNIFNNERLKNLKATDCYYYNKEIAHNQLEEREYYIYHLTPSLKKTVFEGWEKANAVVCYKKHNVDITGKEANETRYYLTSLKDVNDSALVIRNHWGENKLHWNLDTVLDEDMMTMADKVAVTNRSIINKMCLALYTKLQEMSPKKERISKKSMRKSFGWGFEDMMHETLIMLDPKSLSTCLTITSKKADPFVFCSDTRKHTNFD